MQNQNVRVEGTSTSSDTNCAFQFLDPTGTGGTYSGAVTMSAIYITNIQTGITIAANCTGFDIQGEFYGNNPSATCLYGIDIASGGVGHRIHGYFQGWDKGVRDSCTATRVSGTFESNVTAAIDGTNATFPQYYPSVTSGASVLFPGTSAKTIFIKDGNCRFDETYAEFGLGYREYYRTFALGDPQAYSPTYGGLGGQTWGTITATTIKYTLHGHTMTIIFMIDGTAGGTANPALTISLPSGFPSVGRHQTTIRALNGGAWATGYAECLNTGTTINLYLDLTGATNWTSGAVATYGEITIQV